MNPWHKIQHARESGRTCCNCYSCYRLGSAFGIHMMLQPSPLALRTLKTSHRRMGTAHIVANQPAWICASVRNSCDRIRWFRRRDGRHNHLQPRCGLARSVQFQLCCSHWRLPSEPRLEGRSSCRTDVGAYQLSETMTKSARPFSAQDVNPQI